MDKRGQITVFVILGIMVLIAALSIIYLVSLPDIPEIPEEAGAVKSYFDSCVIKTAEYAIINNSLQGGYYRLPVLSNEITPFYFYNLQDNTVSLKQIEENLADFMNNELGKCIDKDQFSLQGINIEYGIPKTNAIVSTSGVYFELDFPVVIKIGERTTTLDGFTANIDNVRLYLMHNTVMQIAKEQKDNPYNICLSCLADVGKQKNLVIDVVNLENNEVLFTITDHHSLIDELPLVFRFTNKYEPYTCLNLPGALPDSILQSKLIGCAQER